MILILFLCSLSVILNIYILYICYYENNVSSGLSPKWLCGNSCTWAHDVWLCHKAIVVITRRAYCFHDNTYYAHLAFVRFEHSVCRRSLKTIICMYVCLFKILYFHHNLSCICYYLLHINFAYSSSYVFFYH